MIKKNPPNCIVELKSICEKEYMKSGLSQFLLFVCAFLFCWFLCIPYKCFWKLKILDNILVVKKFWILVTLLPGLVIVTCFLFVL